MIARGAAGGDFGRSGGERAEETGDGQVEVGATVGDEVGVRARGLDEFRVHRFYRGGDLVEDGGFSAAAFLDVAVDPAGDAQVAGSLHEHGEAVEITEGDGMERENALQDDDPFGAEGGRNGHARMGGEIVDGTLDGAARAKGVEVGFEQFPVDRVGMIEVDGVTLVEREVREVAVVRVDFEDRRLGLVRDDGAGESRLSGSGPAGDADDFHG